MAAERSAAPTRSSTAGRSSKTLWGMFVRPEAARKTKHPTSATPSPVECSGWNWGDGRISPKIARQHEATLPTCRREALTATVPALLQPNRSPPSQALPCAVPHGHPRPTRQIHSFKPVWAAPFFRSNHASTTWIAATAHSKRIALSCQTGKASFNASYRKHRGPTTAAHPGALICRSASDTVLGVLGSRHRCSGRIGHSDRARIDPVARQ